MEGQVEDIRRAVADFERQATKHEEAAARLEATLPIMRNETRIGSRPVTGTRTVTRTRRNSAGETVEYTEEETYETTESYNYTVQVIDPVATAEAMAQVREMRAQAAEVRKAAKKLERAAVELEDAIARTYKLFRQLFEETRNLDAYSAARLLAIKNEIADYINKMQGIRDSFGGNSNFTLFTADSVRNLMVEALGDVHGFMGGDARFVPKTFCPTLAQVVAGIQSAAKDILDPINSTTGNFYYTKDDIVIPGRYPLVFKRFYNSVGGMDGVLGINWTHNYNIRLYNNEENIHIVFDDGHAETYKRLDNGMYAAPADRHNVLIADENGGFCLHFQTLEQYQFSQSGALSYIIDPNGHETALEYDGDLLTSVQTDCGKLSFSYNDDKLLSKVSDHTGRNVTYEYQQNQLTKATHPSGAAFEYKYVGNGLISEQIDPLGIATVQNEYDSQGRTALCGPHIQTLTSGISTIQKTNAQDTWTGTKIPGGTSLMSMETPLKKQTHWAIP